VGRDPINPLAADLDRVIARTQGVWPELRQARLFVTGGTGFFGCWLLETFVWANRELRLGASAQVLTRDPAAFARKCPHLASDPALAFVAGDVRSFEFSHARCDFILHAATEASSDLVARDPLALFDTIVAGTRQVLDLAAACGARALLLTSSGAIYGKQPPEMRHMPEDYAGGPDPTDPAATYAEGKRAAEQLAVLHSQRHSFAAKIARGFAFVGPYLPLDRHFAVGNFLRDGLRGGPIRVNGDGTPYRSYLYAADLAIWLWTILVRGAPGRAYNVGSEADLTIAELAHAVAKSFAPAPEVLIARPAIPGAPPARYVPSTARAQEELGLGETIGLREALRRTIAWHRHVAVPAETAS
jgi:nucleoside-diphosphate-sugar epimerase